MSKAPKGMTPVLTGKVGSIHWAITRAPVMGGNGYVLVPDDHPWADKNYDNVEPYPDVHGGLTYSHENWLGFDTAHSGDFWSKEETAKLGPHPRPKTQPSQEYYSFAEEYAERHWTIQMLINEAENLAKQANKVYKNK